MKAQSWLLIFPLLPSAPLDFSPSTDTGIDDYMPPENPYEEEDDDDDEEEEAVEEMDDDDDDEGEDDEGLSE